MNDTGVRAADGATRAPAGGTPPAHDEGAEAQPKAGPRMTEGLSAAFASACKMLVDFFDLISLEVHRAGVTFMWMMAWSTFAVLLIVTAWIGLMAGLALWAMSLGVSPVAVVLGIALANLIGGALILFNCLHLSRDLLLPATRRQLGIAVRGTRQS